MTAPFAALEADDEAPLAAAEVFDEPDEPDEDGPAEADAPEPPDKLWRKNGVSGGQVEGMGETDHEVEVPWATVMAALEMVLPLASVIHIVTLVPSGTSTGFHETLPD